MKKIIYILSILFILTSCDYYTITYKIKIIYNNGDTEIIDVKRNTETIGSNKPILHNGCLYRKKITGETMWSEDRYVDNIRCGVRYFKTISTKKQLNQSKPLHSSQKIVIVAIILIILYFIIMRQYHYIKYKMNRKDQKYIRKNERINRKNKRNI